MKHAPEDTLAVALRSGLYKTSRHVGIDGRRRDAKRWRDMFKHYIRLTDGKHQPLVEQLASLIVQQDALRRQQLNGDPGLEYKIVRTASQITYIMRVLGLTDKTDDGQAHRDMIEAGLIDG